MFTFSLLQNDSSEAAEGAETVILSSQLNSFNKISRT